MTFIIIVRDPDAFLKYLAIHIFFLVFSQYNNTLSSGGEAHKQWACSFSGMSPNHRHTWRLTGSPLLSLEVDAKIIRQAHYKPSSGTQEMSNIMQTSLVVLSSTRLILYAARQTPHRTSRFRLDVSPREVWLISGTATSSLAAWFGMRRS